MTLQDQIHDFGRRARAAARQLRLCTTEQKNAGIRAMADELLAAQDAILAANAQDLEKARANGLSGAMLERLKLDPKRLASLGMTADDVASPSASSASSTSRARTSPATPPSSA